MNKVLSLVMSSLPLAIFHLERRMALASMKVLARLATAFLLAATAAPVMASSVQWNGRLSLVKCDQIGNGMEFTLDEGQRVPRSQVDAVCSCIATDTNQKGWELRTLDRMSRGEEVGFIPRNGAISRFGKAVNACTAGKFYQASSTTAKPAPSEVPQQADPNRLSLRNQQILGFVGGGPIGIIAGPAVYNALGGNLLLWIIVGLFFGSVLWSLSIYIPVMIIQGIVRFLSSK
jgi:hypothetical protein